MFALQREYGGVMCETPALACGQRALKDANCWCWMHSARLCEVGRRGRILSMRNNPSET